MKKISLKCTMVLLVFLATIAGVFCTPFFNFQQTEKTYATSGNFSSIEEEGFWSVTDEGELPYALYTKTDDIENPYVVYNTKGGNVPAIVMSSKDTANGGDDILNKTTLHLAFNIPEAKTGDIPNINTENQTSALLVDASLDARTTIVTDKSYNTNDVSFEFEVNLLDALDEKAKVPEYTTDGSDRNELTAPSDRTGCYTFLISYNYTDNTGWTSENCTFEISFYVIDYCSHFASTNGEVLNVENANLATDYKTKYTFDNDNTTKPTISFDATKVGLSFDYETNSDMYSFTYFAEGENQSFSIDRFYYPSEILEHGTLTGKITLNLEGTNKVFEIKTYYAAADESLTDAVVEDVYYYAKFDLAEFEEFLIDNNLDEDCCGDYEFKVNLVYGVLFEDLEVNFSILDTTANMNLLPQECTTETLSVYTLEVSDIYAVTGSKYYGATYNISEGLYKSKTSKLLKETGEEFLIYVEEEEETDPDAPESEPEEPEPIPDSVVDPTDLPEGIESISFNDDGFYITKKSGVNELKLKLKYQVEFIFEDDSTLTETADITILFHDYRIVLIDNGSGDQIGRVQCEVNNPLSPDVFKQYIDTTKTTVPIESIVAEYPSPINFYTETTGSVEFSCIITEIAGEPVNITVKNVLGIEVVIPADFEVSLQIGKEDSFSNSINLGKVDYSKDWEFSGQLKSNVKGATISISNTENFFVDIQETADFGIYDFTLKTKKILRGEQTIIFSANFMGHPNQETITFVVDFEIKDSPSIVLNEETITLKKGTTFGEVKDIIKDNIYLVYDIYGEKRTENDVAINQTSLTSLYSNDSDVLACGEYVVTYTYTSNIITGLNLTAQETFVITVVNNQPVFDLLETKITSNGEDVENNSQLYVNRKIDLNVVATDDNNDTLIFELNLENDATITTSDVNTNIVPNTSRKYTISSTTVDNASQIIFTITPAENYVGEFRFSISVFDDGTHTGGDSFEYLVTYYETGIPVIELKTSNILIDGEAKSMEFDYENDVWVLTILQQENEIDLYDFIERADDEFDKNLSVEDLVVSVKKGVENQTLNGTSFRFNGVGEYEVKYSLTDVCGNTTTANFKVIVNEIPNSTPTISPYILNLNEKLNREISFNETLVIDIDEYFTISDADAKDVLFYENASGVFKNADMHGEKILCTNSESFSWNDNVLTFKQDSDNYYVGKLYIAIIADDGTGFASGRSDPAYIEITFVDNIPPVITETNDKTTFVIGSNDGATFNKASYFKAVKVFDGEEITPVVDIRDGNNQNVTSIDFTKTGTYTLNYYFVYTPVGGTQQTIEKQVTINVITGGHPTIVLTQEKLTITVGKGFNIKDIISQIQDDEDGTLTYEQIKDKITIVGMPEDLSIPGEYKITISYLDSDGNPTQSEFTLSVVEPSMAWMWILIAVGGTVGLALIVVLIIAIKRRRYMRI